VAHHCKITFYCQRTQFIMKSNVYIYYSIITLRLLRNHDSIIRKVINIKTYLHKICGNIKLKLISSSSSSKVCPLYSGFPSPKTKFRHLSLSLVSSSVSPCFVMLRLTPSIHLSLGLPLLRVPSGSHSKIFRGSLFPGEMKLILRY
jgi:hypothetical protein